MRVCREIEPKLLPYYRIAMTGYPYAGKVVCVDTIVDELATTLLVHVHAARLTVMNITPYDGRIRTILHLDTRDTIRMNIALVEIALCTECL